MLRILPYILLFTASITVCTAQNRGINNGEIRGIVMQIDTETPIEGAVVTVVNLNIATITESDGSYTIKNVSPGYQRVHTFCPNYQTQVSESFLVNSASETQHNIYLDRLKIQAAEVRVVASALKAPIESPVSFRSIGTEEIDLTPGANRDISKVVQLSAGVVPISFGNRNDVLVRGGSANENKYYLDGIEIPVLNHFAVQGGSGGYASLVNTELLSGVNFYTGGFPSEFTNGVSSVLDMRMKTGNSEKFGAKLILGASDVGVNIDTPISKNGKTTLLASYRRSYLQLLFNVLGLPFLPTYNDFQFKINSKITKRDEVYLIGLGSYDKNKLNLSIDDPDDGQQYILGYLPNNDQYTYVVGLGYKRKMKNGEITTTLSNNLLDNRIYKYHNNDEEQGLAMNIKSRETEFRVRSQVKFYDLAGFTLKAGFGAGYGKMRGTTEQEIYADNEMQQLNYSSSINLWRYDVFATLNRELVSGKLYGSLGLRADGMSYSKLTSNPLKQISPRFSLTYNFAPKWSLGTSVGRYYQEPEYTTLAIKENEATLKYMAVDNYTLGIDFSPNRNSKIKLEGFYKQYHNTAISLLDSLPVSTADLEASVVGAVPAASRGKARAYGMEFTYRNVDLKNTIINFTYTLMRSEQNKMDQNLNVINNEYWASSWDVNNIINISAIHKFPHNWSVGAKWYFVDGLPYTPYDYELSSRIDAWDATNRPYIDPKKYNQERSSPYHQLDIRIDKVWYFKHWRLGFYIDVQNVYNQKSTKQALLLPETDSAGNKIIDPNKPGHYKMKTLDSSFGGTVLPTLGITIEF